MYAGNSVVVNILMRWPALIPVAVVAGVVAVAPIPEPPAPEPPVPVSAPAIIKAEPPAQPKC